MAAAAIQGDYTDLRFIKSRKVAVISVEIPIEAANAFVLSFGTPSPASGIPVALARMQTTKEVVTPTRQPRRMQELPFAQQAALLCDRPAFARFVQERYKESNAVEFLRFFCGVNSRSDIKPDTEAAARFLDLSNEFETWMVSP